MTKTSRHFNIAGPNRPEKHYTLPALARLPHVMQLVQDEAWFVLHAPRQTGKTTAIRALAQELTASGSHAAVWATCEAGEPYRHDPAVVERLVCESITTNASLDLPMDPLPSGLVQLDGYLSRLGLTTGTLLLFDARSSAPTGDGWTTRGQLSEHATPAGRTVTVIRL